MTLFMHFFLIDPTKIVTNNHDGYLCAVAKGNALGQFNYCLSQSTFKDVSCDDNKYIVDFVLSIYFEQDCVWGTGCRIGRLSFENISVGDVPL